MFSKLLKIFLKPKSDPAHEAEVFNFQNQIKTLELQLQQMDQQIIDLRKQILSLESQAAERENALANLKLQALFESITIPCSQLVTQQYLHTEKGVLIQSGDILQISARLLDAFEKAGLTQIGFPGQSIEYDPEIHASLNKTIELTTNQPVIVKFVGFRFQNTILQKAQVEADKG